jgi:DNA-binding transcriptional ArsR family regulator
MDALDRDTAFELLSNERRRQLLSLLAESNGELTLQAAARHIAARGSEVDPEEVSGEEYRSVYVSLSENHIDKLVDEGVVDYDEDAQTIRLANGRRARHLLRIVGSDTRRSWRSAYAAVVAVSTLAGAGTAYGVVPWLYSPWLLSGLVAIAGLLSIALVQYWFRDRV